MVTVGEPIWEVIKHARGGHGFSQRQLAEELALISGNSSVTRDDVKRWENGKRIPRRPWLHWLGEALEIPPDQLRSAAEESRRHRDGVN